MTFHFCSRCRSLYPASSMIHLETGKYVCTCWAKQHPTMIVDIGDFHMECCPEAMTVKQRRHMMAVLGRYMRKLQKQSNETR